MPLATAGGGTGTMREGRGVPQLILIGIAGVVALLVAVAAMRRADYHVERRLEIAAPATTVFGAINDLRRFSGVLVFFGSRWDERDPAMTKMFDGPAAGTGQTYTWSGNREVGRGKLTIEESVPDESVRMKLEFEAPMKSTVACALRVAPAGPGSLLVWSMDGRHNLLGRAIGIFVDMDKMLGGDIEKGIALLKTEIEGSARHDQGPGIVR